MTTAITLLKQLKAQLAGKLQPERVERKPKADGGVVAAGHSSRDSDEVLLTGHAQRIILPKVLTMTLGGLDRFSSYRDKIIPKPARSRVWLLSRM
jgi:hypothetical protein